MCVVIVALSSVLTLCDSICMMSMCACCLQYCNVIKQYTHTYYCDVIEHAYAHSHTGSEDYIFAPSSGSFAFLPSTNPSQQQCYNVDIRDDATYESTEEFSIELSTNVSRVNLITSLIQIEIEDNDRVTVGLNQTEFAVVEELQSGGVSFTVCTVLTGTIEKTVVVRLFSEPSSSNGKPSDGWSQSLPTTPIFKDQLMTICIEYPLHT